MVPSLGGGREGSGRTWLDLAAGFPTNQVGSSRSVQAGSTRWSSFHPGSKRMPMDRSSMASRSAHKVMSLTVFESAA
eukprot:CAMPEP_0182572344 /NCGR_PEP_ID=MMETSP1324-20130603/15946_1 /TAXON_ID=236786 /ORGANISM="Florenciella sp., Strain RCC1587" /LENGTH=76 /DNA_ID=CAMNT_0024787201 /DNA_START=44 /DNA_END=271 /DNA_ORIENTATION=+